MHCGWLYPSNAVLHTSQALEGSSLLATFLGDPRFCSTSHLLSVIPFLQKTPRGLHISEFLAGHWPSVWPLLFRSTFPLATDAAQLQLPLPMER